METEKLAQDCETRWNFWGRARTDQPPGVRHATRNTYLRPLSLSLVFMAGAACSYRASKAFRGEARRGWRRRRHKQRRRRRGDERGRGRGRLSKAPPDSSPRLRVVDAGRGFAARAWVRRGERGLQPGAAVWCACCPGAIAPDGRVNLIFAGRCLFQRRESPNPCS